MPGRPSSELRRVLVAPSVTDPPLADALARRGVELRSVESRDAMLQVLDPDALARRLGERVAPGETPEGFLRRLLPPERLAFWPADRF